MTAGFEDNHVQAKLSQQMQHTSHYWKHSINAMCLIYSSMIKRVETYVKKGAKHWSLNTSVSRNLPDCWHDGQPFLHSSLLHSCEILNQYPLPQQHDSSCCNLQPTWHPQEEQIVVISMQTKGDTSKRSVSTHVGLSKFSRAHSLPCCLQ